RCVNVGDSGTPPGMFRLMPTTLFFLLGAIWVFTGSQPGALWLVVLTVAAGRALWSLGSRMLTLGYGEDRQADRPPRPPVPRWAKAALVTGGVSLACLAVLTIMSPPLALVAFGLAVSVGCVYVIRVADPLVIDFDDLDAELAELLAGGGDGYADPGLGHSS